MISISVSILDMNGTWDIKKPYGLFRGLPICRKMSRFPISTFNPYQDVKKRTLIRMFGVHLDPNRY